MPLCGINRADVRTVRARPLRPGQLQMQILMPTSRLPMAEAGALMPLCGIAVSTGEVTRNGVMSAGR